MQEGVHCKMGVGAEGGWFAFSGGAQRQVQAWCSGV